MSKGASTAGIEDFIETTLAEIDEKIQEIDNSKIVRAAQKLLDEKAKLQSARRALLGAGSKTVSSGGSRVTQAEVVAYFEGSDETWHSVEGIASAMGHTSEVIRGHLNRGKGERFRKNGDNMWALRDPETDNDD